MGRLSSCTLGYCLVLLLLLCPSFLYAAEIQFVATPPVASVGSEVGITIMLNTEGKAATALSGEVTVTKADGEKVVIERIRDGASIIGAWLSKASTNIPGKTSFKGIIPGGITTPGEKVLTLFIIPRKAGTLTFTFSGEVFLSAAPGDPIPLPKKSFALLVRELPEEEMPLTLSDSTPPEDIRGTIAQNDQMFDGRPFIIVHAKDSESGILLYELLETSEYQPLFGLAEDTLLPWRRIENPEALLYPANTRYIYVRVTDREGNSAVALVGGPPQLSPEKTATLFNKWLILAILIGVTGPFGLWLWFRRRKNHAQSPGSFTNAP